MRTSGWLRTGLLLGLVVPSGVAACGSDDTAKKDRPRYQSGGGEGGGESTDSGGSGVTPEAGEPSVLAGSGGVAGSAPGTAGEAGAPPIVADGGAAGMMSVGGAGGETDPGPRECATGTADCDDNHDDCETNTATDPMNCGRCERACGGAAACTDGWCGHTEVLNPTGDSNWCDAVFSPTTMYMVTCWGSFSEVRVAPIVPAATIVGTQVYTATLPVAYMRGIMIDGNDVLFGVQGSPSRLYKFPLDANGPEDVTVAYTFENGQRFDGIQLVGDTFYWNHNTHTAGGQIAPGYIEKRTKAGTSTTTLVTGLGLNYNLQVFASQMLWLERRTTNDEVSLYRAPIAGAAIENVELVAPAAAGAYMIRQGDYVYWTEKVAAPNGKVRRVLADDTQAEVEDVATGLEMPEGLIADADYVYFKQTDILYRAPLAGGAAERLSLTVLANDAQATRIFYVDDKYVYFAAGTGGGASTVARVAK